MVWRCGTVSVPPCHAVAWGGALCLAPTRGPFSPPQPQLEVRGVTLWGGRRGRHHAGIAGALGGAAAAGRERRGRAAARGRRGAHPAAVPAVPGADAGAGDPERAPQRLHVVLDLLALLAQLGHGAGPLPLPRPFGLDGRGARDPSGRRGIGASSRGCRRSGQRTGSLELKRSLELKLWLLGPYFNKS